ncbi:MAG: methyltransferase domain-containing protein [Spirochaetales bacterium]|nr:methyltransferase domain-containing protein [Spirochaetales bacterium]
MSERKQNNFDEAAARWKTLKYNPWAKMRYEISGHFIRKHLAGRPVNILNVGCGDGIESLMFDDLNARHTLSDYSEKMLEEARTYLTEQEFRSPYTLVHSDAAELPDRLTETFDLILFHNVMEYVSQPQEVLQGLVGLLNRGGIISVRHLNRYANFQAAATYAKDLELVERYLTESRFDTSFGMSIPTYTGEEVESWLVKNGLEGISRYGVMTINSFISDNELKSQPDFFEKLKSLEIQWADQFPYFHSARFGLFLAQKKED